MLGLSRLEKHAELVERMAETLGVDLTEEQMTARMTPEDLHETVLRCTTCLEEGACQQFLTLNHDRGADTAPSFCRNKALLEAMRPTDSEA